MHRAARRCDQPEHEPSGRGLPGSALADEAECFTGAHVEINAVDGAHLGSNAAEDAAPHREPFGEVADLDERTRLRSERRCHRVGARASGDATQLHFRRADASGRCPVDRAKFDRRVPTLVLVKGKRAVARLEGRANAAEIEELVEPHLEDSTGDDGR